MSLYTPRLPAAGSVWLAPVEPRRAPLFCLVLLMAACALASFAFACATPFAAFAVVAAAMLPWRPALLVVTAAWLVNQAIGFGVLHYPLDRNTVLWGFGIGVGGADRNGGVQADTGLAPASRLSRRSRLGLDRGLCGL